MNNARNTAMTARIDYTVGGFVAALRFLSLPEANRNDRRASVELAVDAFREMNRVASL
jgi:hypothetical protein